MTDCTLHCKNEHLTFDLVNTLEELIAAVSIADKMVLSPLVKDGLLLIRGHLEAVRKTLDKKDSECQNFSAMTSTIQQVRQTLPKDLALGQDRLLTYCQSAAQLCLSRSICGRLIKILRHLASDCSHLQELLVYMENVFVALDELSKLEDGFNYENQIVEQVVARCKEVLQGQTKQHSNVYEEAWEMVCKAKKQAESEGIPVVITVVDKSAEVVMTYRMEDALLVSTDMAYKKAYTSVAMKMPSKDLAPLTQPGQWLFNLETMTDNKVVSLAGGVPIYNGDSIIGAIGISGGSAEQDQRIAEAALV